MTTSARSAIRSVTLPLPSSPHWAPTTTRPGMVFPSRSRQLLVAPRAGSGLDGTLDGGAGELALAIHIGELRIARQERENHVADRPVAVLGDEDVRLARTLRFALRVVLVAVDEHDEVGVLLDLPRFTQIGEHRLGRIARLDRT